MTDQTENRFRPMIDAPKDATEVLLLLKSRPSGKLYLQVGHWAHGGGEEQPPFGPAWFYGTIYGYREITDEPINWFPIPQVRALALND